MATNFLKLTREQLAIITGGDPRAIKAFEDFLAYVNALGAHATTHEPGGSDPLTVDAAAAVGSLRTLGTGAQKAAAGIHAATHVTGGGDPLAFAPVTGTAAALAALNPVLAVGQLGWETDTLSGKIGDGATAYNSLTYFYRGLPVAGEPSLGTPHHFPLGNTTSKVIVATVAPPAAGNWSAAITASDAPSGAKAMIADVISNSISAAGSKYATIELAFSDNNSNTPSASTGHPHYKRAGLVNAPGQDDIFSKELIIPLDASKQFYTYSITLGGGGTFTYSVTGKGYIT